MKKKDFVTLLLCVVGGLLFSLGMCMVLLAEWNARMPGIVMCAVGAVILITTAIVNRKMSGKPMIAFSGKTIAITLYSILSTIVLGTGFSMVMAFEIMIPGIIVGIVGIVMLLCLIPICKGLK